MKSSSPLRRTRKSSCRPRTGIGPPQGWFPHRHNSNRPLLGARGCRRRWRARAVQVDHEGHVDLERWAAAVGTAGTAAACIQVANHEVGTLQPYAKAAEICQRTEVPLVLDATAALGRIDFGAAAGWSVLTGSAGAFGGPASVGILVIKKRPVGERPTPPTTTKEAAGRVCPMCPPSMRQRLLWTAGCGTVAQSWERQHAWSISCVRESCNRCPMSTWPAIRYAGKRTS